jgi:acetyl esterase/lipase
MTKDSLSSKSKKVHNKTLKTYLKFLTIIAAANFACLTMSGFYILSNTESFLWNLFGIVILVTFILNLVYIYFDGNNKLKYLYVFLFLICMAILPVSNTISSLLVDERSSLILISYLCMLLPFILGSSISVVELFCSKSVSYYGEKHYSINDKKYKLGNGKVSFYCSIILSLIVLIGIVYSYLFLTARHRNLFGSVGAQLSLLWGYVFLSAGVAALKLNRKHKEYAYKTSILVAVSITFIVCTVPLLLTPFIIKEARREFYTAFSPNTESINNMNNNLYLMKTVFSLPAYFYPKSIKNYTVKKDILYYEKPEDGVQLFFDVYMPNSNLVNLPGKGSTLIRIHGGAWIYGDKGMRNLPAVSKYFASQGYTVFDIQYGLKDKIIFKGDPSVPDNVKGDFNIDDMMYHIGMFTRFLEKHSEEYDVNIESVFISGGSAGGHLSAAAGLAIKSEKFHSLFSHNIKIRGIIPFYPAIGYSECVGIDGTEELKDPSFLIDENSPPCLIFQGTHDGLVDAEKIKLFREEYLMAGNRRCAIILMPLGGHVSDAYFSCYYNQIFTYYMERFMYMYK